MRIFPGLGAGYSRLWTAAVVSRLGDSIRTPAFALLVATMTRDPRAVATVVVAGQLPPLLFGLLGGVYADRWDRRRTMVAVDGLRALLVAALAVLVALGQAGVPAVAGCAFALAALGAFFDAAAFALLPAVVPAERLAFANGRLQAGTAMAGGFVGAPLAGVLFALAAALPFAVDALSFALAALLVLTLSVPTFSAPAAGPTPASTAPRPPRRSVWREAGDGWRWLRGEPVLLRISMLAAATNLAISGLIAVVVFYALDVLGVPERAYGLFMAAAALGGLVGALNAGRFAARVGVLPGLRIVLLGETLALVGLAATRQPVLGALALAVFSAGTGLWNSLYATYGQRRIPAELRGRVGATQRMVGLVAAPVGALLAGLVAEHHGVATVAWSATIVFVLVTAVAWPTLTPQSTPGQAAAGT